MKSLLIFLLQFILWIGTLNAGGFEYAYQVAYSNRSHRPNVIATDRNNNVIVGGNFNSCIVCSRAFIDKRDGNGGGGGWFKEIDPLGGAVSVRSISTDSLGNVYVILNIFSTDQFGLDGSVFTGPDVNWSSQIKFNPAGLILWQIPFYGTSFIGTVDQGGASFVTNGDSTWKYSSSGNYQWKNISYGGSLISVNSQDVFLGSISKIIRLNKSNGTFNFQNAVPSCLDIVAGGIGTVFFTGNLGTFRLQSGIINWSNTTIPGKAIARNANDLWVLYGEQVTANLGGNPSVLMTKLSTGSGDGLDTITIAGTYLEGTSGNLGIDNLGKLYTTLFWKDYGQYAVFPPFVVWQDYNYSFEGYILSKYDPYLQTPALGFAVPVSDPNSFNGLWNGDRQCPGGTSFPVQYVLAGGNFLAGNTVSVELSDAIGDFNMPVTIGSISTTSTTGVVNCLLPNGILPGSGYRMRITSTSPVLTSVQQTEPLEITSPISSVVSNGALSFCAKTTSISCLAADPGFNIEWYKNGILLTDGGGDTYLPKLSGTYSTIVTDFNGCRRASDNTLPLTVWPIPSAAISQSGSIELCTGSSINLSVPNAASNTYTWYKYAAVIPGIVGSSYMTNATGNYKVKVTNSFGCSKTSSSAQVKVFRSTITASGATTFCAGGSVMLNANVGASSYQWKRNNVNIAGANASSYLANQAGTYKVFSISSGGCESLSSATIITINCREGISTVDDAIILAPNPGAGLIRMMIPNEIGAGVYKIFSSTGQLILTGDFLAQHQEIVLDFSGRADGIYLLRIETEGGKSIERKMVINN
ncbi:hypothetical protein BH11BAC2_BH11BAC2_11970 [soil metagenome]